jgi:hypothetical protein
VNEDREVDPSEPLCQTIDAGGVVEMTMAADDCLKARAIDTEEGHGVDHPVGADSGVEENPVSMVTLAISTRAE